MSGFLSKVRVLTLGTAHDLLDKAIDMNSPTILRQYVRDLEDAQGRMQDEAAMQAGAVRTAKREIDTMGGMVEKKKAKIVELNNAGKTAEARALAGEVVILQKSLVQREVDLTNLTTSSAQMDLAVQKLINRHTEMLAHLRELERLDRDTKGKEMTSKALESAGKLMSTGADISVDNIEDNMRRKNDVASEKFDRAMGSVNVEEDESTKDEVDALMESLKPTQQAKTA